MGGWWGKAQGLCLRIALVFEYLGWAASTNDLEPTEVSTETLQNAINFMDSYAGPMADRAHGIASTAESHANTLTLARYILDNDFADISVRELQRSGPMRNLKAPDIKYACFDLVGLNWLQAAPIRQSVTPGKTQGRFLINPVL